MWPITGNFPALTVETTLPGAGFSVGSTRGVARVEKYGCAAEFRRTSRDAYQMTIPPSILLRTCSATCCIGTRRVRLWR